MSLIKACSKCESEDLVKKGSDTNVKYAITPCTVSKLGKVKLPEVLRKALQLYLEGLSFRGIERIWKVSHGMVIQWVRR